MTLGAGVVLLRQPHGFEGVCVSLTTDRLSAETVGKAETEFVASARPVLPRGLQGFGAISEALDSYHHLSKAVTNSRRLKQSSPRRTISMSS
jgi:hypothetical protein